ncbi:hypothetical protein TWF102_007460 [Orbilia oligospora]|uniref:AAA+ ATPase domain-containing protein n=1 Tax=Orbilia oligospora TaxID=2813651 RepID=A0A7C8JUI9_ORBOL|nr:hypothetical protein TWF102_007460 [Orbilia oligospora]KAF3102902.1 hypothetical protein TWF103_007599 [Orbilia oligospora]KAF3113047.1 hypothetical protein TWF706_010054 [Orbilia oligospora]KAF3119537.1 hypothetical protein TWF703_003290 [Orbilia oligospora]KAF3127008.1 hypothetical protein TWF594_000784 [Orbilia oligospora]
MSDDEMDLDDGPVDTGITFSTIEAKGKRSAANLPVEVGDSLPWVEKYRPQSLDDVSGHEDILTTINKFIAQNKLPHLLFYGPPGTGKTSTILALARRIYNTKSEAALRHHVLELNASDDRGIDVVREQIKTFASTKQIFSSAKLEPSNTTSSIAQFKLIILDEADAMTSTAQNALRRIMEKYTSNVRFCIIANYTHKLNAALLSRCTRFRFSPLPIPALRRRVEHVIDSENVRIDDTAVDALLHLSRGDMRRALNVLQACFAGSTPLDKNGVALSGPDVQRDLITETSIYDCVAAPHPEDIQAIMNTLLTEDITTALITVNKIKTLKGLALTDILQVVAEELCRLEVKPHVRVQWLAGMAEIEGRVAAGGNESIQTAGFAGVVKAGAEMIAKG